MKKIRVGILGASGFLGRTYVEILQRHPWFTITFLAGSRGSVGKRLSHFLLEDPYDISNVKTRVDLLFSALPLSSAAVLEEEYVKEGIAVFTSASSLEKGHLVIADISPELFLQEKSPLVVQSKSALQNFFLPLYPLHKRYGLETLQVTALQSIQSAGPSFPSGVIIDNVVPNTLEEEKLLEKQLIELLKKPLSSTISCSRIAASSGNFAFVSASFYEAPKIKDVIQIWKRFTSLPQQLQLPSAPLKPIIFFPEKNRPQLKQPAGYLSMAVSVGRLERSPLFDLRFCASSDSIFRGEVGGSIIAAELFVKKNYPEISACNLEISSFAK